MACNLRGHKRTVFRQFLVDEFHFSAVSKRFDPLFVLHFRTCSDGGSVASIRRVAERNSFFPWWRHPKVKTNCTNSSLLPSARPAGDCGGGGEVLTMRVRRAERFLTTPFEAQDKQADTLAGANVKGKGIGLLRSKGPVYEWVEVEERAAVHFSAYGVLG
jgi:hypothetical protein